MKKVICFIYFLSAVFMLSAQEGVKTLVRELRDEDSEKVLVVAHRGDWRNAPENSLQAFENCIEMGVDMIEIDLKKTRESSWEKQNRTI